MTKDANVARAAALFPLVLAALSAATTLTYTDRPPRGSLSYYVKAYDTSNLIGPSSNTVAFTR